MSTSAERFDPPQESFAALLCRLREGSESAAQELLSQYGHHVLYAVRRRLNRKLRAKFDSQDFTQAVWASFFENRQSIADFETPADLIRFLKTVAGNKVMGEFRRSLGTTKHDIRKEVSLNNKGLRDSQLFCGKQPTPSRAAVAREQLEQLNDSQPTRYRLMLQMRGEGIPYTEIARKLQVDEKTVRRVIERLAEQLEQ